MDRHMSCLLAGASTLWCIYSVQNWCTTHHSTMYMDMDIAFRLKLNGPVWKGLVNL